MRPNNASPLILGPPRATEQLNNAVHNDAVQTIMTEAKLMNDVVDWWNLCWRVGIASELLVETLIYPHTGTLTFTGR